MSADPADWRDLAELRQALYRFVAGSLLSPDAERLQAVMASAAVLADMGVDAFAFATAWHQLEEALDELPEEEELRAGYVGLFVAGPDGPACPPVESQYRAAAGCGGAEVVVELRREYAALGLAVAPGTVSGADHVATELEVMASLCHEEAHAWEEHDRPAAVAVLRQEWTFLSRHLAAWMPRLAARVRSTGATGLYPALLGAAEAFVSHDLNLVTTLTGARLDAVGA
ncbi:MAG TPA: molecular chaperone TorD family protein [Acidimicrobiales bacterium]|nr:molecular chaperone TorD family protein [Acidimicrobiales bacterium]